jgi:hypothetical protein
MRKIILFIITLTIIFSSLSNTFAKEWTLERVLDLNYWVEEFKLNLSNIDYVRFNSSKYNNMYNELIKIDSTLRTEFMKKYRNWEYEYYQINWIITNYNNFVYYINKFFFYTKIKESNSRYVELDTAIINSFRNMRISYNKVKNIVRWH